MKEDQITEALRGLPRTRASDVFDRRLMDRIGQESRRPRLPEWRLAAAAAAVIVLLLLVFARRQERRAASLAEMQAEITDQVRVDALREEYRSLERELIELRTLAGQVRPLVGVEGDGEQDFLIDLRNLYAGPASEAMRGQLAQPASFGSAQPRER